MARVTMTIVHDQEYSPRAPVSKGEGKGLALFVFLLFFTLFVKINSPIDRAPPQENFPCRVFPTESVGISLQSSAATSYARSVVERSNNHLACFARALSEPRHATVAFP